MDVANTIREAEDRTRWKGVVVVICGATTTSKCYGLD